MRERQLDFDCNVALDRFSKIREIVAQLLIFLGVQLAREHDILN